MSNHGLDQLPATFPETREALHLVAARVLGAARYLAVGKMGLAVTPGGFGTPEFNGRRLMAIGNQLSDGQRRQPFSTLGNACAFAGVDPAAPLHSVLSLAGTPDAELLVDAEASIALAQWLALGQTVLEALATASRPDEAVMPIQLWPEHFDLALEMGLPESRANFGASPGDAVIDEPYLYVGPHRPRSGHFWNMEFGAALTHSQVRDGADPIEFLERGRSLLSVTSSD
jgi:hypothetical protein